MIHYNFKRIWGRNIAYERKYSSYWSKEKRLWIYIRRGCNIEPSTIERIAELFIDQDREMVLFMKIKYNALLAQRKYLSALKNAKEIYKLTNALGDAYTVVTLAINVDSDNMCEYMPYIHSLMQSKNPEV